MIRFPEKKAPIRGEFSGHMLWGLHFWEDEKRTRSVKTFTLSSDCLAGACMFPSFSGNGKDWNSTQMGKLAREQKLGSLKVRIQRMMQVWLWYLAGIQNNTQRSYVISIEAFLQEHISKSVVEIHIPVSKATKSKPDEHQLLVCFGCWPTCWTLMGSALLGPDWASAQNAEL